MILEELKNIDSSTAELKKFGKSVGLAFIAIGGAISLYAAEIHSILLYAGGFLIFFSITAPIILLPFQKVWMAIAVILGFVSTRVILALIYYIILTPIAVIGRITGKDFLDEKPDRGSNTYWAYRPVEKNNSDNIKRQY
jgi:hypothetical protein